MPNELELAFAFDAENPIPPRPALNDTLEDCAFAELPLPPKPPLPPKLLDPALALAKKID